MTAGFRCNSSSATLYRFFLIILEQLWEHWNFLVALLILNYLLVLSDSNFVFLVTPFWSNGCLFSSFLVSSVNCFDQNAPYPFNTKLINKNASVFNTWCLYSCTKTSLVILLLKCSWRDWLELREWQEAGTGMAHDHNLSLLSMCVKRGNFS
jgi:hypothetical protein